MAKKSTSKKQKLSIFEYVMLGLYTILFGFMAGIPKIIGSSEVMANMTLMGFSPALIHGIGVMWVLLSVGVWFKKTRLCSLLISSWILAGAFAAHLATLDVLAFPYLMIVHMVVLAILFYQSGLCDAVCPSK